MKLIIQPSGKTQCVYSEALNLSALGQLSIRRGSHVEPTSDGQWTADLSPVNGPLLGPFSHRSRALDAEQQWLEENWMEADGKMTQEEPSNKRRQAIS